MTSELQKAEAFPVDPKRLASGAWCHRAEKTLEQGDINASYSADRIGMGQPIRNRLNGAALYGFACR